jgi:hypothetical protein
MQSYGRVNDNVDERDRELERKPLNPYERDLDDREYEMAERA